MFKNQILQLFIVVYYRTVSEIFLSIKNGLRERQMLEKPVSVCLEYFVNECKISCRKK